MSNSMKFLAAAMMVVGVGAAPASAASWQPQPAQMHNVQFSFGMHAGEDRDRRHRFERRGDSYYYNGYRGSRESRSGWRHYNGFWFPQSAFSFSITLDADRYRDRGSTTIRLSSAHVEWCENRYRSYRAWDNSFQPYYGPRRDCDSPYFGY